MASKSKLNRAKKQILENGGRLATKQVDLHSAKYEAQVEGRLPTKEKEITNHGAYYENKEAAKNSRRHSARKKSDFSWAKGSEESRARRENIGHTGTGAYEKKRAFVLRPGDMGQVSRDIGYHAWPGFVPKGGVGIIVSNEYDEHVGFLYDGQTIDVPVAALRPLNYDEED